MALLGLALREVTLILLKLIDTAISAKMLMVAFGTLLVEKGKLLAELKKSKQQENDYKVVYHDTHHDHHYQDLAHEGAPNNWL